MIIQKNDGKQFIWGTKGKSLNKYLHTAKKILWRALHNSLHWRARSIISFPFLSQSASGGQTPSYSGPGNTPSHPATSGGDFNLDFLDSIPEGDRSQGHNPATPSSGPGQTTTPGPQSGVPPGASPAHPSVNQQTAVPSGGPGNQQDEFSQLFN